MNASAAFRDEVFDTLYFGGGTPSVLDPAELDAILDAIYRNYRFSDQVEFTLEANPDDLKPEYLRSIKDRGINRLSIGVQSFRDQDLELMRRSHNARQAKAAIMDVRDLGFDNFSIDLIYGVPGMGTGDFRRNLEQALELNVPHLSAYHLTYETGTVFDHWRKKGRLVPAEEEESLRQFSLLRTLTGEQGYHHYEISNFARDGFFSKHNLSYWRQVPYIGIGPSAHSYDGRQRRWNIPDLRKYTDALLKGEGKYYDYEELSNTDLYNEYILTSLRTMWGLDLHALAERFGDNYVKYAIERRRKIFEGRVDRKKWRSGEINRKGNFHRRLRDE